MSPTTVWISLSVALFVSIIACLEIGYRLGTRRSGGEGDEGVDAIDAAVFGLLGLLLAFSFSGAATRLDARRQLIVEEANAIGTAYLRLDLLAAADQPEARRLFREYLDARIHYYQVLSDAGAAEREMEHVSRLQERLWTHAVNASRSASSPAVALLVLPAFNEMLDITTARKVALETHVPALILIMLLVVALFSGLLAGYAMSRRKTRSWLHGIVYAFVVSVTVYTVIDLDHPRSGIIRLDAADRALAKLRDSIR